MPLTQSLEAVMQANKELAEVRRKYRADLKAKAGEFTDMADSADCLWFLMRYKEGVYAGVMIGWFSALMAVYLAMGV